MGQDSCVAIFPRYSAKTDNRNLQLSDSKIVLTGGQLHPNLVTEYSGIDNGWQVFIPTIVIIIIIIAIIIIIITLTIKIVITKAKLYSTTTKTPVIRRPG